MKGAKRGFDIVVSCVALFVAAPLMLGITAIAVTTGGPIFFRQERVGLHGRRFRMWKFRTMVPNAESLGPQLTADGDARITRVGKWLRRSKVDELPQLFNVLVGQMSLVGPRPEVPRYVALYTGDQRRVLDLVPGITDPASILYRNESELIAASPDPERFYIERILPDKIRINLEYAAHATMWRDFGILVQTARHLLPNWHVVQSLPRECHADRGGSSVQ